MSTKKRDLAQELVEFLLKEDERKKATSGAVQNQEVERTKPHLVQEPAIEQQKTVAATVKKDVEIFEFNVSVPDQKSMKILDKLEPQKAPEEKTGSTNSGNRFATQRANLVVNDVATLMAGTEAVKVAQARIKTLEKEKDQIRSEMEQLITSSESMQRRLNELRAQHENLERKHREKIEIIEDEKSVLKTRLSAKETELNKVKKENEDLHSRFQSDLRKIRVRERELEHRQEIIRAEMVTVVTSKDEAIVELKRQLEKLHFELDNFRAKSADMNTKINEFHDRNHRTVKALRLALSVLEMGDDDKPKKKEGA